MTHHSAIGIRSDHVGGDPPPIGTAAVARRIADAAPILVEAYRFVRDPKTQLDVLRDTLAWRRATTALREGKIWNGDADRGHLLIVAMSDHLWDVKWRAIVAAGIADRGWRVTTLIRARRQQRIKRYLRAIGLDDFIAMEDVRPTERAAEDATATAEALLSGPMDFNTVRSWSYRDVWVGPQVLASASRRLLSGAVDPTDPAVAAEIERLLPQMLFDTHRAEMVLDTLRPDLGLIDEYHYSVAAPIVDTAVARDIPVVTMRDMWRGDEFVPMRLTARTRRMHHASVLPETLDRPEVNRAADALSDELEEYFVERYGESGRFQHLEDEREALRHQLDVRGGRRLGVIFSHVLWDANLFYGEDLFRDFGDWLVRTVAAAAENNEMDWIVKLHPANLEKAVYHGSSKLNEVDLIREHVGDLPQHVRLVYPDTDIAPPSLYKYADVGITVRGTPGLEMPCYGRPAMTAGTGRFEDLGFTIDSATPGEYLERLSSLQHVRPLDSRQIERARNHAAILFRHRSWSLRSAQVKDESSSVWSPLDRNICLREEQWRDGPPSDVRRIAQWLTSSDELTYVTDLPD